MSATAVTSPTLLGQYAHDSALTNYRRNREHASPFRAAHDERDSAARFLADCVLDDTVEEWAIESYRTAQAIYEAVCKRAGVGKPIADMTARELFWQTGRRQANR